MDRLFLLLASRNNLCSSVLLALNLTFGRCTSSGFQFAGTSPSGERYLMCCGPFFLEVISECHSYSDGSSWLVRLAMRTRRGNADDDAHGIPVPVSSRLHEQLASSDMTLVCAASVKMANASLPAAGAREVDK
jgi:hypothetical protein